MDKNALGLIEVVGLAAGMEAADAAVKAANIELVGYELTKGGGMVVIKLSGDVGALRRLWMQVLPQPHGLIRFMLPMLSPALQVA
nr:BMC domain-containing protein [Desulforamulus aquiferis]